MMQMNDGFNEMHNLTILQKNINLRTFPKKSEQERIMIVLNVLRNNDGLKYWMTKIRNSQIPKNAEASKEFREVGKLQYLRCNDPHRINSAVESFTKSIAYAPSESTELSLAYANRSALLIKARLYDDALLDIKRALKAGYPDRLKAKLFLRRALCLKAAHPTAQTDIEKALDNARGWLKRMDKKSPSRQMVTDALNDVNKMAALPPPHIKWKPERFLNGVFEENTEIVDASSSITIKPTKNKQFFVFATRDIKPGEIISTQQPYAALLHENRRYTNCWHCHIQTFSGVPCNYCVHTVFCSETCRDTAWSEYHSVECQIPPLSMIVAIQITYFEALIIRMIIKAVKEAGSIQALKERIRRIENDPDLKTKGFTGSKLDGSKLSSIYGLPTHAESRSPYILLEVSYRSLFVAFLLATKSKFFGEEMTMLRFYRHELVPFVGAVLTRFHLITMTTLEDGYDAIDSLTPTNHSVMITPLHSYISHSCAPNVSKCVFGSKGVIYAHYPIKRGEQIFLCKGATFERTPKKDRQADIKQLFGCSCWCVACTENWPDTHLPHCNVLRMSENLLAAHKDLLDTIDDRLTLSMHGHSAVIAKLINDLSVIISDWWERERPPALELAQAAELLNRIFFVLGNRRELF